ncbi:MAG: hypothetical protein V4597_05055 [Pseudomonadota bacterium]
MRFRALTSVLLLTALAACGRGQPVDSVAAPAPPTRWSTIVTGAGTTLAYAPERPSAQTPPIRMGCGRDPAAFRVGVERIVPIGSEDRLSVGFDGEPFALAVTPQSLAGPEGLEAEGPITQDLLIVLQTATVIEGSYGATRFGPYEAPPPAMLNALAQACRAAGVSR